MFMFHPPLVRTSLYLLHFEQRKRESLFLQEMLQPGWCICNQFIILVQLLHSSWTGLSQTCIHMNRVHTHAHTNKHKTTWRKHETAHHWEVEVAIEHCFQIFKEISYGIQTELRQSVHVSVHVYTCAVCSSTCRVTR